MKIRVDEQGYITDFCFIGDISDSIDVEDIPAEQQDIFMQQFAAYKLVDGELELDNAKLSEVVTREEKNALRHRRQLECFPYINRGELWYNHLSTEQTEELNTWYQAWLDVTETKVVPDKPAWLGQTGG